jgi:tRNA pseudouridine55 synthase
LVDLEKVSCPASSLVKLRNGNAAPVIASGLDYDQEVWASHDGEAVAVGNYRSGELHPSRVFVPPQVG